MDKIRFKRVIDGNLKEFNLSKEEYKIYMQNALIEYREQNKCEQIEKMRGIDRIYEEFKEELEKLLNA